MCAIRDSRTRELYQENRFDGNCKIFDNNVYNELETKPYFREHFINLNKLVI